MYSLSLGDLSSTEILDDILSFDILLQGLGGSSMNRMQKVFGQQKTFNRFMHLSSGLWSKQDRQKHVNIPKNFKECSVYGRSLTDLWSVENFLEDLEGIFGLCKNPKYVQFIETFQKVLDLQKGRGHCYMRPWSSIQRREGVIVI